MSTAMIKGDGANSPSSPASSSSTSGQNTAPRQVVGKYELGRVLAAGDFDCRTRLCSHIITGASYAVRIYSKSVLAEASWMWDRVRMSIQVQRTLPKHENIIEMVECFETASSLYILMQLFSSVNVTTLFTSTPVSATMPTQRQDDYASLLSAQQPQVDRPSFSYSTGQADACNITPPRLTSLSQGDHSATRAGSLSVTNVQVSDVAGNAPRPSQSFSTGQQPQQQQQTSIVTLAKDTSRTSLLWVRHYFVQVVRGVLHMHNHDVVHLGLAPDHVLINDQGQVRISNLVSCAFCPHGGRMDELRGTQHTVAPEILKNEPYDPYLADAWSLGVLLYFMLNDGHYPYDGANTLKHILYNHIRPPKASLPEIATDLLARLLQVMPSDRLPVEAVLQHPFCTLTDEELALAIVPLNGSAMMTDGVTPAPLQLPRPQQQQQQQRRLGSRDGTTTNNNEDSAATTSQQPRGSSCMTLNDTVARPQSGGSMISVSATAGGVADQVNGSAGNYQSNQCMTETEWRNTCDLPSPLLPRRRKDASGAGTLIKRSCSSAVFDTDGDSETSTRAARLLARFTTLEDRAAFVIQRVFRARRRRCLFREDNMALILAAHSEDAVWRQQQQQQQRQPLSSALGTSASNRTANETPTLSTNHVTAVPMSRMIAGRVISPGPLRSVAGSFSSALQASMSLDSVRISSSRGVRLGSLAGGLGGVVLSAPGQRLSVRRETNANGTVNNNGNSGGAVSHRLSSLAPYVNHHNNSIIGAAMTGRPSLHRGNTITGTNAGLLAGRLPSLQVNNDIFSSGNNGNGAVHGYTTSSAVRASALVTVVAPTGNNTAAAATSSSPSLPESDNVPRLMNGEMSSNNNNNNANGSYAAALRNSLAAAPRPGETCPLCHRRDVAPRRVNLKPYASSTYNYENGSFTPIA